MVARLRHSLCSAFGVAIYLVCTALVCSFIFFEVLDIDGSDFPGKPKTLLAQASRGEAEHDMRRAFLTGGAQWGIELPPTLANPSPDAVRLRWPFTLRWRPHGLPPRTALRVALPRGSLSDVPHPS